MSSDLEIVVSAAEIERRVAELAEAISKDYAGRLPLLLGVLKGAVFFLVDLVRHLSIPVGIDFMAIASYGGSAKFSGPVKILKDIDESIAGRHVLIVEGIVDTGLTVDYLLRSLRERAPASLEVCTLLEKPARREVEVPLRYRGFAIPNHFVVGYGLDYNQRFRELPDIAVLDSLRSPG